MSVPSAAAPLRLIVLRHAESAWPADTADHDRPLDARGRSDARVVGQRLRALGWTPGVVLSSDARRARETWDELAPALDAAVAPTYSRRLYHAGLAEVREAVAALEAPPSAILVLGHNPGWEQMASALSGTPITLATANAALLEHPGPAFRDALRALGAWHLAHLLRP